MTEELFATVQLAGTLALCAEVGNAHFELSMLLFKQQVG
jgi:hypothetical protein